MDAPARPPPRPTPIPALAEAMGLRAEEVEPRGRAVAKIEPSALLRLEREAPQGRLVVVTAITPTAAGEGKTTVAIGLVDALCRLGVRAIATLRQPSLGPVFGRKGGGAGGGRARLEPPELVNLHLTGDLHAVAAAHGLAAALLDSHLHHGNALAFDPAAIAWPRALDLNDRALRRVRLGLARGGGPEREGEFIVAAASEVMAALALAGDLADLRRRLGRMIAGRGQDGAPITLEALRAAGAMAALLVDAARPNLLSTAEGSPALVHAGPFGNVATGTSSVVADRLGLRCAEVVVTEAGFGSELGAEKLVDLKCRQSGLRPSAAVLVATVRALRAHGGGDPAVPDVAAVRRGCENLRRHLAILERLGLPAVVALNVFPGDGAEEQAAVREAALAAGAVAVAPCTAFVDGGAGALALAEAVQAAAGGEGPGPRLVYADEAPLAAKIEALAREIYGADGVDWSPAAAAQAEDLERHGLGRLPVCVAKTHLSLSHDPALGASPRGFRLPVRELRPAAGAGFVTALCGEILLMPGLPAHPAAEEIDVDGAGRITGLR